MSIFWFAMLMIAVALLVGWCAINFILSVIITRGRGPLNWRMFVSAGSYEWWLP